MKILLINQAFYPDPAATGMQLAELAFALAAEGHDITVLTARRGYTPPNLLLPAEEKINGVRVVRTWPYHFGKENRMLRMAEALLVNLAFAVKIMTLGRFDRVLAMTSPPLVAWFAAFYSAIRKIPFVYWVMDINPDEAIQAGWIKAGSWQAGLLNSALRFVLARSRKVIVLDEFMKENLTQKGADPEKIEVLPPLAPGHKRLPAAAKENLFRSKQKWENKFVVMYAGNHSVCHPLDTILEAALILKDDPDVVFAFIGGGVRTAEVETFKKQHQLDLIVILPYQPEKDIAAVLSAADLHAVTMGPEYVGIVHPSKIYGILKAGRSFVYVGSKDSAIGKIVSTHAIGYQINHGDAVRLVEIVNELRASAPEKMEALREKIRSVGEQHFSGKETQKKLIEKVTS